MESSSSSSSSSDDDEEAATVPGRGRVDNDILDAQIDDMLLIPTIPEESDRNKRAYEKAFGLADASFSLAKREDDKIANEILQDAFRKRQAESRKNENQANDWYCDKCDKRNFKKALACIGCGREKSIMDLHAKTQAQLQRTGARR